MDGYVPSWEYEPLLLRLIVQMYTREGKLVAVMTQEGVVRANIRDPSEPPKLKL